MNKRTVIVIALIIPLVALGYVLSKSGSKDNTAKTNMMSSAPAQSRIPRKPANHRPTLDEERTRLQERLAQLKTMTPDKWDTERLTLNPVGGAPTLQAAINFTQKRLDQLNQTALPQGNAGTIGNVGNSSSPSARFPDVAPPPMKH